MKRTFCVIALLSATAVIAQSQIDNSEKKVTYGFNIGVNYGNLFSIKSLPANAQTTNGIGFKTGILMYYALSEHFAFSPKAEISLNNCGVNFSQANSSEITYKISPTTADLMAHLVFNLGKGRHTPYILLGPTVKLPIYDRKPESTIEFRTKTDLAIDFGIGLDNKLKYFTWAPEIRYSYGLFNINNHPELQTVKHHSVSLIVNFR